ncbi:hypothetical protein SEA_KEELAN_119 [Gordonia phage Keelan]|nr:hypothetical protein SEA_KEELAN_119 [Gordonia phage Keelan]
MNCVVGQWVANELDDDDRDMLNYVLEGEHRSKASVHRSIILTHGNPFSLTAFKDHVNGRCSCGETSR